MDITITENKSDESSKGKKMLAIYELKGNELRMAMIGPGKDDRPSDFSGKVGVVVLYKKAK